MLNPELRHRHSGLAGDGEKIRYSDIEGKPELGSSNLFSGTVAYSSIGVKTVSGVGFTPKMIEISCGINGGNTGYSDGTYYSGSVSCRYIYFNAGVGTVGHIGYSGYMQIGGNSSITTTVTPTSDGFTINVADVSAGTIQMSYKCFG